MTSNDKVNDVTNTHDFFLRTACYLLFTVEYILEIHLLLQLQCAYHSDFDAEPHSDPIWDHHSPPSSMITRARKLCLTLLFSSFIGTTWTYIMLKRVFSGNNKRRKPQSKIPPPKPEKKQKERQPEPRLPSEPPTLSPNSTPAVPNSAWSSQDFLLGAGMVVFQPSTRKIVVLHEKEKHYWFLPRGRKDVGESLEQTALREAYEEVCKPFLLYWIISEPVITEWVPRIVLSSPQSNSSACGP